MLFGILPKGVFGYAVMPRIMPRIRNLWMGGFHYVPFFLALVYQLVRLLPQGHPYLMPQNMGRYGVRHVIAEAGRNLIFNVKNLDQILLFGLILEALPILPC